MPKQKEKQLNIRNMVCPRCVMVVRETLEGLGHEVHEVELGSAEIAYSGTLDLEEIDRQLKEYGFELIKGKNQQLVEQIKTLLIHYVQDLEENEEPPKVSAYLSEKLHQNYSSLSSVFSEQEETTIEKYLIHLKIERVKELLSYGEMTLSEIAWKLNYSSVQYLSNQFKKNVGMSVSEFKKKEEYSRKSFDAI